jgi:hypothetical protein
VYSSPNIIRVIKLSHSRWIGVCSIGGEQKQDTIIAGKRERRRPFGTSAPKWEDNIEMRSNDTAYAGVAESIRQNMDI